MAEARLFHGGSVYLDGRLVADGWLLSWGERIVAVGGPDTPRPTKARGATTIDLAGDWLVPGFVDLQVNGGGGALFNATPDVQTLSRILAAHCALGTTSLLATLITDTAETMAAARKAVADGMAAGLPGLLGVHWEGPWLSPGKPGVHRPELMRTPTAAEITALVLPDPARTLVTLAPETVPADQWPGLAASGAILFAGHSAASGAEAEAAFRAGVRGVTHLYNAMSGMGARAPGLAGAALDTPAIWASLIGDGHHVDPAMIRLAARAKPDRLFLVSDAMPPVGDGADFDLHGTPITARGSACVDGDGRLAGSATSLAEAVRSCAEQVGLGWEVAIAMATSRPASLLGLAGEIGTLCPGARADLVRLRPGGTVAGVWQAGIPVVPSLPGG